jgi:hypothetical protein
VRFEVLKAASVKTAVFWIVEPCSLVEVYRRFRGACCLHHQGDESPCDGGTITSVNFYQTTQRNNPEGSGLQM